jgi:hypothetical protein
VQFIRQAKDGDSRIAFFHPVLELDAGMRGLELLELRLQ